MVVREFDADLEYNGVYVTGANTRLIVESSEFSGLMIAINAQSGGNGNLTTTGSTFRNNFISVAVANTSPDLGHVLVDHCTITNSSGNGVYATMSHVVVSNSTISGSGQNTTSNPYGFAVDADSGGVIALQNDLIEYNLVGAEFTNHQSTTLGIVESTGNNTFLFNRSDVSGSSLTSISTM